MINTTSNSLHPEVRTKVNILRQLLEALMWEITTLTNQEWENLPAISERKSQITDQLKKLDWTPSPLEREDGQIVILKAQILDLELKSKMMIKTQMNVIKKHQKDLMLRHRRWQRSIKAYRPTQNR